MLLRSKTSLVGEGVVELVEKFDVAHKCRVDEPVVGDVVWLPSGCRGWVVDDEVIEKRRRRFSRRVSRRMVRTRVVNVVALNVVVGVVVAGVDGVVGGRITAVGRD